MQILHSFAGSLQQYEEAIADPDRYRPDHCPQCQARQPMTGHGFYRRTLVDVGFDETIRVRRYLCPSCKRTVSLLPEFALPYLRISVSVIALFLIARLREGRTLVAAAVAASQLHMPYQRGQFCVRRSHVPSITSLNLPNAAEILKEMVDPVLNLGRHFQKYFDRFMDYGRPSLPSPAPLIRASSERFAVINVSLFRIACAAIKRS